MAVPGPAHMYARLSDAASTGTGLNAPMRLNASRLNYHGPLVALSVDGTARHGNFDRESVRVSQRINQNPDTASLDVFDFTPSVNEEIVIGAGSLSNRLFRGTVTSVTQARYRLGQSRVNWHVEAIDWTYQLNKTLVTKRYLSTSATAIAKDLIATYTSDGFDASFVEGGLPTIDEIDFTMVAVGDALTRLADRVGGYWRVDYEKQVHFFTTPTLPNPELLDNANTHFSKFTHGDDIDQLFNRVLVEGLGTVVSATVAVGQTTMPVINATMFSVSGGTIKADRQQLLTYSGADTATGDGSTVSNALAAPGAPSVAEGADGVLFGSYKYKVALGNASGTTAAGTASATVTPDRTFSSVDTWDDSTPLTETVIWESSVWSETLGLYCAVGQITGPAGRSATSTDGINWTISTSIAAIASLWTAVGWSETLGIFVALASTGQAASSTDGVTWTSRTAAAAEPWRTVAENSGTFVAVARNASASNVAVMTSTNGTSWTSRTAANNLAWEKVVFGDALYVAVASDAGAGSVMTSPDGTSWTTRTTVAGGFGAVAYGTALDLFVALSTSGNNYETSSNGTSWTQRTLDAGGGNVWEDIAWSPEQAVFMATSQSAKLITSSVGTSGWSLQEAAGAQTDWNVLTWSPTLLRWVALGNHEKQMTQALVQAGEQVALSSIDTGVSPTTLRTLYRTKDAGSDYFLLDTLNDNNTTTYTDNIPDSALGAAAPTVSTVEINISDTAIRVLELANFSATGGWLEIGSQRISYTGRSGSSGEGTLTGVPQTGPGAVSAEIAAGTTVLPVPSVSGIPSSGAGSILTQLETGDAVHLLVTRNDTDSQVTYGVREHYIQDRRLSITGAQNRADATLSLHADPRTSGGIDTTDPKVLPGKDQAIQIYTLNETRTIQAVEISYSTGDVLPNRSTRFSSRTDFDFYSELRSIREQARGQG